MSHQVLRLFCKGFERSEFIARAPLQELPPTFAYLDALAQFEGSFPDPAGCATTVSQLATIKRSNHARHEYSGDQEPQTRRHSDVR
jgi:hypothetical protein